MWFFKKESDGPYTDLRLALYNGVKQFVIVLAAGLALKLFVFDSLKVNGSQMEPAIRQEDRILIFKTPYIMPFIKNISGGKGKPVVISLTEKGTYTITRIAAASGDTVSIESGQFYRNGVAVEKFSKDTDKYGVIPAGYSPNDFMGKIRVPAPRDSIDFRTLNMHDFIFAYSVFKQEAPGARLKTHIVVDDTVLQDDFVIKDFSLYRGRLDAIPEELHTDWFFWDRLQSYLSMTTEPNGKKPQLAFSVLKNGKEVGGFRVKGRYVFALGDNWNMAKDSRHLGPLSRANIKGRPFMTLWGADFDGEGKKRLNWSRIVRFVR